MPDDQIMTQAAVKILVSALGYRNYAEANGGFPVGYMRVANRLDLYDNINTDEKLNYVPMVNLIYNALLANTYEISGITNGNAQWEQSTDETLLRKYFKLVNAEGKITGVRGLSLENIQLMDNQFTMNGEKYDYDNATREDWVGKEYSVFYKYVTNDDRKECVYVFPLDEGGSQKIDISCIDEFSHDYKLTYYETKDSNKKKNVVFSKDAVIYLNGSIADRDISSIFNDVTTGYVYCIDFDENGTYEYVSIKSYKNIVVSSIDKGAEIIYDAIRHDTIDLSSLDTVKMYNASGDEFSIDTLKENMTISAAISDDYAELLISTDILTGSIQVISEDEITVSDNVYFLEKQFNEEFGSRLNVGSNGEFYLNYFGEIVYYAPKSIDGLSYGYLYDLWVDVMNFGEDSALVKIFSENGQVISAKLADRVKVDGVTYKEMEKIVRAIPDCSADPYSFKRQMLRYSLNQEGEINVLDTLYFNEEQEDMRSSIRQSINHPTNGPKTYELVEQTTSNQNTDQVKRIGLSNMVNNSVKVMQIPSDAEFDAGTVQDKSFSIGNLQSLGNQIKKTVYSYRTDIEGGYEDVVLMVSEGITEMSAAYIMIVDTISEVVNDEGDIVTQISGMQRALPASFELTEDAEEGNAPIEKGDCILPLFDSEGNVADYYMIYDYSAGGYPDEQVHKIDKADGSTSSNWKSHNWFTRSSETGEYYQSCQISFMYAGYTNGNILKGYCTNNSYFDPGENDEIYDLNASQFMFYDPDQNGGKAVVGNISDIRDIKNYGSECSRILYQTNGLMPRGIVIYR